MKIQITKEEAIEVWKKNKNFKDYEVVIYQDSNNFFGYLGNPVIPCKKSKNNITPNKQLYAI